MVVEHPEYELVGCFAHSESKIGKDVGDIVGIGKTGVLATGSIEDIIALKPDVVLYMTLVWNVDDMAALLRAGINVISTIFITGRSLGEEARGELERAAQDGGVTLYGTGINPGLLDILALSATSACAKVHKITARESVDASHYASAETWIANGFGGPPDAPGLSEISRKRAWIFIDVIEMMARALKIQLDEEIGFDVEFSVATEDLDLGFMQIAKGMVCGLSKSYRGMVNGEVVVDLQLAWRLGNAMTPDWTPEGYVVEIEGEPKIRLTFHAEGDELSGGVTTATTAVHAVAAVCAAHSGIVTADELPMITAAHCVCPRSVG
jgi:hypothetical protein